MGDFASGLLIGTAIGVIYVMVLVLALAEENTLPQQAFDRGYMVECIGKTGYYWKGECDE